MLIHDTKRRVELAFSVSCQHRDKLIELAARHMMPAIYSFRMGLMSYGSSLLDIHPASIPVSREHRRAKTDRLDAGLLMRAT